MAPMARSKFGTPCSNLKYFGSECTVLKNVLVTLLGLFGTFGTAAVMWRLGNCAPLAHPRYTSDCISELGDVAWLGMFASL